MNDLKNNFEKQGFIKIPSVLTLKEVETLKKEIENILLAFKANHLPEDEAKDIFTSEKGIIRKICYPLSKSNHLIPYLTHPNLIDVVQKISDEPNDFVLSWEDILIKEPYQGIEVAVHQDLGLQSVNSKNVFSLGIYLHDSLSNPVYFLPESHHYGPLKKRELTEIWNQRQNEFIPVIAVPGDMIVHNVLTLHYSLPNNSPFPRYTWYLEFRNFSDILFDSKWDYNWALKRQAILKLSFELRKENRLKVPLLKFAREKELLKLLSSNQVELKIYHENENIKYNPLDEYNHFQSL